jgi:hypothetical protein
MGANQFDIEFSVINMADFEGAIPVPWSFQIQFEIEGFLRVRRTMSHALQRLTESRALPYGGAEGHIAGSLHAFLITCSLK